MQVLGREGIELDEVWERGPFAYMSISVPDFPNFFFLNGPNSPVGNFSLIDVAERQVQYVLQLAERVRSGACGEISASHEAMERFDTDRRKAAETTIWNTGCRSWYLDEEGLPTAWPWTFDRFCEEMDAPRLDDYELA
jgi:cation diffusion facilitator CzcD-associated flavoprotein CzcO